MKSKLTKVKKLIIIVVIFFVAIFIYFFNKANKDYPKSSKIIELKENNPISYEGIDLYLESYEVSENLFYGYPVLDVCYKFVNNTNQSKSLLEMANALVFYQDYEYSIVQNINEGDFVNEEFDISYNIDDLEVKAKQTKYFTFKYIMDNKDRNYENFIYINKHLYYDEYMDSIKKGKDLYKIIKLGRLWKKSI